MSKRVQRYECGECERMYQSKEGADECEQQHVRDRESEARELAWNKINDRSWRFTMEQIEEVAKLLDVDIASPTTTETPR